MLNEQKQITANAAAIRADLAHMTRRWGELTESCVFEIRAFKEHSQTQIAKFARDWIDGPDGAVEWCESMNKLGFNVYAVRNPIRGSCSGPAKDTDIVAAFHLWADCDDPAAAGNVLRFDGPKWTSSIVTGTIPSPRAHVYWELNEPCLDMAAWREMQSTVAAHFASDPSVINPSRIMRVAGTVSYPSGKKQERGYVSELTELRTEYPDQRQPVTIEQMARVFGERQPARRPLSERATPSQPGGFNIDTGGALTPPLDRERLAIQALSGSDWHSAVIRLVASYVGKGLGDSEIHALTQPLTLSGYTGDQTYAEVQIAIDGARRKGWTPEPAQYAAPAFQIATAAPSEGAAPAPSSLEWFDDIAPVLTDSYIVKGVLGAGSMSVIYGPSNSGKTFFALDLAYHIAAGLEWRGLRVKPCGVLYLAAEGGRGVANRIAALKEETGAHSIPFALRRAGMDLLHQEADLQKVFTLAQEVQEKAVGLPCIIVIDTLSRVMAGGDENSAADMTALIRNIDAIREATGAHIMLVHHTGKDTARGARGHSSLRAATDTEIEVQNEDGARAAQVTKQRDYPGGETFAFSLKNVDLGIDQDGDQVNSCVVVAENSEEFTAAKKATKGRGKNQILIMEAFDQMVADGFARGNPSGVGMPEAGQFWAVDAEELRRISQGKIVGPDNAKLWRQAWTALTGRDAVFVTGDGLAWRVDRRKK